MAADFIARHIGPSEHEQKEMLKVLGFNSIDDFISRVVPAEIRTKGPLKFPGDLGADEAEVLARIKAIASKNTVARSFIGMGYYPCHTPTVIQRNILENPAWYTAYTPYQPEISQGRLEALLNFQTMISDLTGLPVANASLLDEGTAAAEAMAMCLALKEKNEAATSNTKFFVASECHPQTIAVVSTRARALGVEIVVGAPNGASFGPEFIGALFQYPGTTGHVEDLSPFVKAIQSSGGLAVVACDLLALTLLTPPGEFGADIAVGSSQRFGIPLGFGGPHAAFFAVKDEHKRLMPGRLVGVSRDAAGQPALRLALQTREQHIRREKATSNICTAQVLLAVMASMYAVYHGRDGLIAIAMRARRAANIFGRALNKFGIELLSRTYFDTISFKVSSTQAEEILKRALNAGFLLRLLGPNALSVSFDECVTDSELLKLVNIVTGARLTELKEFDFHVEHYVAPLKRRSVFLTHKVFNSYRSETEFLRYLYRLQQRDLALTSAMIPLGSCTMKLNATTEMMPVTWPEFSAIHPFAPAIHASGYGELFLQLEEVLKSATGFTAVSLQPNAGSQGEYAGLLAIRAYHETRGDRDRKICLIPKSAHGTNPASAVMAGFEVVVVACDANGNIDVSDLEAKVAEHAARLGACMVTFPSTHGVFEESIKQVCAAIHRGGGQVYMDGANMNALVGLVRPAELGADVCHINLHKTFCIPHGGGGPGVGPIGVAAHLAPYLPGHPVIASNGEGAVGPVSAAPWGSAGILPISWCYAQLMGAAGLVAATKVAILNANYIAAKLESHYPVLYRGRSGYVAHECIFDLRQFKSCGVEVEDVAKRLMDYGFHAPTVSFPVPGTLMVEPTESESKAELDRFCEALVAIRSEIATIESGAMPAADSPLKHAPHTSQAVTASEWDRRYSREQAAFPTAATRHSKFWPSVGRIDGNFGDRNLVCSCAGIENYE